MTVFHYNETGAVNPALDSLNAYLTGITDENGVRYATYRYDASGKVVEEIYPAAGINTNRYQLSYDPGGLKTTVTDPLGSVRIYNFTNILGVPKKTRQDQPGGSGCAASFSNLSYDANGNVASRTDFNGNKTTYTHDLTRNLETSRVEAVGKPEARTISTRWHPFWRLATAQAEPGRLTTWVYNGQPDPVSGSPVWCAPADAQAIDGVPIAVVCRRIEQATTDLTGATGFSALADGSPHIWRYAYDHYGNLLSEDGPRSDVADLTTYEYWPADAQCPGAAEGAGMDKGCRGQLRRMTDAAGHVTDYLKYDAHGQLLRRRGPNGAEGVYAYDARGRLTARTEAGLTTSYRYDPRGLLDRITLPDGAVLNYQYDAAHRLTGIQDNLGNRVSYTLDPAGNRIKETLHDPGNTLARQITREFDALSRMQRESLGAQP